MGLGINKEVKEAVETDIHHISKESTPDSQFKVYDDEIPPIPLDDYTPMEIDEEPASEATNIASQEPISTQEFPSLAELPSFEELAPPDFDSEISASEYDTEFVLEEESETLGSVLKDLGWDQEED